MRIQYASHFFIDKTGHLPLRKVRGVDALILLGGVGSPHHRFTKEALWVCSKSWPRVLWVPGEYERRECGGSMDKAVALCKRMASLYSNVQILDGKKSIDIGGICILGLPPWLSTDMLEEDIERIEWLASTRPLLVCSYDTPFRAEGPSPVDLLSEDTAAKGVKGWLGGRGGVCSGMQNGVFCATNARFAGVAANTAHPFYSDSAMFELR